MNPPGHREGRRRALLVVPTALNVTNGLVSQDPKLLSVQPVVDAAVKDAVGSSVAAVIDLANVGVVAVAPSTDVTALPRGLWSRMSAEPERTIAKIARAVLVIAAGALAIAKPSPVLTITSADESNEGR